MDGAHDLGGMHGFGDQRGITVPVEDEAPFHERWEARVWAMAGVVRATTIDRFRYTIEQMPPGEYLTSSYFERWLWAIERLADEQSMLDSDERPLDPTRPSPVAPTWVGRFAPGDRVRVRNAVTAGHTRVPRYLRNHLGTIERVAFAWPNPGESAATGAYGDLELHYTVRFAASDLFGPEADHQLTADLGESDLEDL